jgi:hypothetical protein
MLLIITEITQSVWYSTLGHPECIGGRNVPDYQAFRTTDVKIRGLGNVQKKSPLSYSTTPTGGNLYLRLCNNNNNNNNILKGKAVPLQA